ncbi:MAG: TonB-dependent receptor plug domain-containing protein [Bacteroidales bacterium]
MLGESNLINSLRSYLGVFFGKESSAELMVRGSYSDQNLILLDGSPVYNLAHGFGFISSINNTLLSDIKLYKGGIPTNYGGYLSSTLDISQREGNNQKLAGEFNVGTIALSGVLEAPIIKDKASFPLSIRKSLTDFVSYFMSDLFVPKFWDGTLKSYYKINDNNSIHLSVSSAHDQLHYNEKDITIKIKEGWGLQCPLFGGTKAGIAIYCQSLPCRTAITIRRVRLNLEGIIQI